MLQIIFYLIFLGLILCLVMYGFLVILKQPFKRVRLKKTLTKEEIGFLERSITGLKEVIIIGDRFEIPTSELYRAIKENFKNGVKYRLLVSKSNYITESLKYLKFFKSFIEKDGDLVSDFVTIDSINFEWNDYPYIFYKYLQRKDDSYKIFAYVGTERKGGIADNYELIPPTLARKIIDLALERDTTELREIRKEIYNKEVIFNSELLSA